MSDFSGFHGSQLTAIAFIHGFLQVKTEGESAVITGAGEGAVLSLLDTLVGDRLTDTISLLLPLN